MGADELEARRLFRRRLDELGEQYPELRTPGKQARLEAELARQEREGVAMVEEVERPKRGRPKGTGTAGVSLQTTSFKASAEFTQRLKAYAKQRRQSVADLIRDGLEWRLNEGDPLTMRSSVAHDQAGEDMGESVSEALGVMQDMLTVLTAEVRQLRQVVEAREQGRERGVGQGVTDNGIPGNTISDACIPEEVDVPGSAGEPEADGEGAEEVREGFDRVKYRLGKLCPRGHAWKGTGLSLRYANKAGGCLACDAEKARAKRLKHRGKVAESA